MSPGQSAQSPRGTFEWFGEWNVNSVQLQSLLGWLVTLFFFVLFIVVHFLLLSPILCTSTHIEEAKKATLSHHPVTYFCVSAWCQKQQPPTQNLMRKRVHKRDSGVCVCVCVGIKSTKITGPTSYVKSPGVWDCCCYCCCTFAFFGVSAGCLISHPPGCGCGGPFSFSLLHTHTHSCLLS